jgi:4a-hydroxytetrahydrobiopterin dehydratase
MGVPLNDSEVDKALASLLNWTRKGAAIERDLQFDDFLEAMKFVNRVASVAEQANHHPDIHVSYNKVKLSLISHDSGGLTQRDMKMAGKINAIVDSQGSK